MKTGADTAHIHGHPIVFLNIYYSTTLADNGRHVCSWNTSADILIWSVNFKYTYLTNVGVMVKVELNSYVFIIYKEIEISSKRGLHNLPIINDRFS